MSNNIELLDEDLKKILGKRYEDMSDKFTPEAQERRRNNREVFTIKIVALMLVLMTCVGWANSVGIFSTNQFGFWIGVCSVVIGYNLGVCVCHNKGWRD